MNELIYKLKGYLYPRPNNKINTFPPFGNEFLPPSKNISFTVCPIIYPLKNNDIYDYDPKCIMSSGLCFMTSS